MHTVDASIVITAPRDKLFALSQDYAARLRWDPFLTDMKFKHGATEASVGVQVWVRARNRLSMTVEYITVDPPNVVAMKMIAGLWLFRKFSGAWLFRDKGAGRTHVTFRYNFQCRLGPAKLVAHPLIARVAPKTRTSCAPSDATPCNDQGILPCRGTTPPCSPVEARLFSCDDDADAS